MLKCLWARPHLITVIHFGQGRQLNAWNELQQFYCLFRIDSPPPFYSVAPNFRMRVFNNSAGSGPDANECRWSSQQLEWSAWVETADYAVLQAKRIMAVFNLITANGKMTCVCVCCDWEHEPCLCVFIMCVLHVCLCVYSLLVNASSAHGCGSAWVRFSAALT